MTCASRMASLVLVCAAVAGACADTRGEELRIPVFVQGIEANQVPIRGGTVTLSEAQLAFGPLYVCASAAADFELCESALGELLEVHTLDALDAQRKQLAVMHAVSGTVRGAFYDYGISWLLTQSAPEPSGALSGHAARLVGLATGDGGEQLSFVAEVDIQPSSRGTSAVHGATQPGELRKESELTIALSPASWLARVRFEELVKLDEDGDGQVVLVPGSQPYEAIVQALTLNATPQLIWR